MRRYKFAALVLTIILSANYMFASLASWQQGDNGWQYQNEDGSFVHDSWLEFEGNWYYFDSNGNRVTGSRQIGMYTYFFNQQTGAMVTSTVINEDGFSTVIDKNGVANYLTDHIQDFNPPTGNGYFDGQSYINPWADYQITLPQNYNAWWFNPQIVKSCSYIDFCFGNEDDENNYILVYYVKMPSDNANTPEELITAYARNLTTQSIAKNQTPVMTRNVGGYDYSYVSCFTDSGVYNDMYCRIVNEHYMFIQTLHINPAEVENIINTMNQVN